MYVIGLDAGGKSIRRGAFTPTADGGFVPVTKGGVPVRDKVFTELFPGGLVAVVQDFLNTHSEALAGEELAGVGYGYAGAFEYEFDGTVEYGRSHGVNMKWPADDKELSASTGVRCKGWNDLKVMGYGINFLNPSQLFLMGGDPTRLRKRGAKLGLIAPGSGTGACGMEWNGKFFQPTRESEFGHIRCAPHLRDDFDYLSYLWDRRDPTTPHPSLEAGIKLARVYGFVRDVRKIGSEPEEIARQIAANEDPAPLICELGKKGESELCAEALKMFWRLVGAAASDLTLAFKAFDGCFIGGTNVINVGPDYLTGTDLMSAFTAVGHHGPRMKNVPVSLLLEETGDMGAAYALHIELSA
jgi:glucokinase